MPEQSTTPDLEEKLRRHVEAANRSDLDTALAIVSKGAVSDRSPVGREVAEGRGAIRDYREFYGEPQVLELVCLLEA